MPKLADQHFNYEDPLTGKFTGFMVGCSVDSDGNFQLEIPETFYSFAETIYRQLEQHEELRAALVWSKRKGRMVIQAKSLANARTRMQELVAIGNKVEKSTTEHIVYRFASTMNYWVNLDGTLAANGSAGDGGRSEHGSWKQRADRKFEHEVRNDRTTGVARNVPMLGLAAYVMTREVRKRGGIEEIEWDRYRGDHHAKPGADLKQDLNSWNHAEAPESPGDGWVVVPYDEQTARFFLHTIQGLCKIDHALCTFFDDTKSVQAAIEGKGTVPLLR